MESFLGSTVFLQFMQEKFLSSACTPVTVAPMTDSSSSSDESVSTCKFSTSLISATVDPVGGSVRWRTHHAGSAQTQGKMAVPRGTTYSCACVFACVLCRMRAWYIMRLRLGCGLGNQGCRLFLAGCTSSLRLKQLSTDKLSCKWSLCFVGPESARKRLAASSNSFAYWLFHAITFERKAFSKIHELKSKKSLR